MRQRIAALALLLASLSACTTLPDEGPVREVEAAGGAPDGGPMYIDPLPPQPGDSPAEVVKGFLDAMQATPIQTSTARRFLTREAGAEWEPDAATVTYDIATTPRGRSEVVVTLTGAARFDGRGAWQGPLPEAESTLRFPVVREDGEYRIAAAPDAMVVPESWFEPRFRQVSLYFFDATGRILVPDPVYVPQGPQLASTLVRRLLAGPPADLAGHLRSKLPTGARAGLSVPVSDGRADVRLERESAPATSEDVEALVAQLTWTLRQDPAIERVRVTVGDRVLQRPDGRTDFDVAEGEQFAPYVAGSTSLLYGLRQGLLVSGVPGDLDPVLGPFGRDDHGLRTVAVSLDAERAAAVTSDGTRLLLAAVHDDSEPAQTLLSGAADLLGPAWDFAGRVWVVDRRPDGARVTYLRGRRARTVDVEGITGARVEDFLLSRDGTRLVAVVRGAAGDRVVIARLLHEPDGGVVGALRALPIGPAEPGLRIRDIAWRSPTGITALVPVSRGLAELRELAVDGSPAARSGLPFTVRGRLVALAGSPSPEQRTFGVLRDGLLDLADAADEPILVPGGVRSVGYAG